MSDFDTLHTELSRRCTPQPYPIAEDTFARHRAITVADVAHQPVTLHHNVTAPLRGSRKASVAAGHPPTRCAKVPANAAASSRPGVDSSASKPAGMAAMTHRGITGSELGPDHVDDRLEPVGWIDQVSVRPTHDRVVATVRSDNPSSRLPDDSAVERFDQIGVREVRRFIPGCTGIGADLPSKALGGTSL